MGLERTYLGEGRGQSVVSTAWQKPLLVRDLVVAAVAMVYLLSPATALSGDASTPETTGAEPAARTAPTSEGNAMKPFVVAESVYKAFLTPGETTLLDLYQRMNTFYEFSRHDPNRNGSFVITPLAEPQHPRNAAFTVYAIGGAELADGPSATMEDVLSSMPDFGMSRRLGSSCSAPESEFVSLRGVGTGASNTLVLLDGVPFNDPFGGWVSWSEVPAVSLARAEIVPDGGATAWGEGALGGVVQLFTFPPSGELAIKPGALFEGGPTDPSLNKQVVVGTGEIVADVGSFESRRVDFIAAQPTSEGVVQVLGSMYSTEGSPVVSSPKRGPIDIDAWGRHNWLEARWRQLLGKTLVLTATVRETEESHGDGTPYQQGSSVGKFASLALASPLVGGFAWNSTAYVQTRGSSDTFAFVAPKRSSETPALDQVSTPATSFGGSWTGTWWQRGGSSTNAGVDLRFVRGEAREEFAFADNAFTRGLVSGGDHGNAGIFLLRDQELSSTFRALIGARVDAWNEGGGHQEMTDLENREVLGAEKFANASGTEFSPSVGLVWRPSGDWRLHVNAQQSYSRPTLSELYQPYGWDSVVTQSNPLLKTEHNTSFEVSAEYTFRLGSIFSKGKSAPDVFYKGPEGGMLVVGATAFSNDLRDAVGTLTLVRATADFPIFTTLPPGYIGQQLLSLDRSTSQGGTIFIQWGPTNSFSLSASLLFNDSTIDRSSLAPQLNGKQTAGVSRQSFSVSARWHATDKLTVRCLTRVLGPQFEDDENTLRLREAIVVDLGLSYRLEKHTELFISADNIGNAQVVTNRNVDGILYLGTPQMFTSGLRLSW